MQYNFKLGRVVGLGFGSVFVVMFVIGAVSKITTNKLIDSNRWVSHTYQVERNLGEVTRLLVDAETGQRGFILTQKVSFLEPYNTAVASFEEQFNELKKLIQDNPEQTDHLMEIKRIAEAKMASHTEIINLAKQGKRQAALAMVLSGEGKQLMDEIRKKLAEMVQVEEKLLAERQQSASQAATMADLISLGGMAISIAFGSLVLFFIAREIVRPVNQVANAIAASSNEIAATVEQQERAATQQAASVNQTTTTMDELSASAQQSAQQAETASTSAQQVLILSDQGNKAVTQTRKGMTALSGRVNAVADQMVCLREQTSQIGSISGLVSDLANQTNMLALNAAVEAVRAGEQGKGFGVVAAEIRKLADESKRSAEKINVLVGEIQSAINSTVVMTDESTRTATQGTEMTEQAVEVFSHVTEAVNSMALNIQQISLNAKQQATAVQQVLQAMNSLNTSARETASGISQTRVSTHQLNDAARRLQTIV